MNLKVLRYRHKRVWKYYAAMNGKSGRAITGSRRDAAPFPAHEIDKILAHLNTLDNRGWEIVDDKEDA